MIGVIDKRHGGSRTALLFVLALVALAGCSKSQNAAQAKHYNLHGRVVSIDRAGGALVIDGDAIPDFMPAMTMPYTVHDKDDLTRVGAGDEITADVVLPENSSSYIENVAIVNKSAAAAVAGKRYHLHGKIVSIDNSGGKLVIDGDDIPGFMSAMTMPYPVRDKGDLSKVRPGDEITADVVVPDNGSLYIENIVVVKKGSGAAPASSQLQEPQQGQTVPDFVLLDQDGRKIHLASYRGDVLLVTFIYTRCPFPDFCPLVSKNFAHIYADTKANAALRTKMRLLSISFDPDHDTPAVLKKYGESFRGITGDIPFSRWDFAVVPKNELKDVTSFFGVSYTEDKNQFVHSMSTSVITPDGKIFSWHEDTDWKPADLIADATDALSPDGQRAAMASEHSAGHEIAPPGSATN